MSAAAARVPAPLIAAQLASRAEELVRALFPDAAQQGHELRWRGPGGAWCAMVTRGGKQGLWCNFQDERQRGDALELVHFSLFPDETGRRSSIQWAARWLGIDVAVANDPGRAQRMRELAVAALAAREAEAAKEAEQRCRRAKAIYLDGREATAEVTSYLAGRGIDVVELSGALRALRFSDGLYYDAASVLLPAMLAPIIVPTTGAQIGTQATYLRQEGGAWRKARVKPGKKSFGSVSGGVVPLLRGGSQRPLRLAPEGDVALIAEGIENALAASLYIPGAPRVLACLGVANLAKITLPLTIKTVVLVFDRDGENDAVRGVRKRAVERFQGEGRTVDTMKPPAGVKDFADYVSHEFWGAV